MSARVGVRIEADVKPFADGMQRATKMLRDFLTLGFMAQAARAAIEFGSRITDLSNRAQVTARWLQEVGYAAQMAGASMDDVANAVLDLSRAQVQALGGSAPDRDAFRALGISVEELRTLRPEQLFDRIAAALQRTGGSAAEVNAALVVMGRGGRQLIGGLADGFDQARQRARDLGLVLDDDVIEAMDELGDRLDTLKLGFTALTAVILKNMMSLNNWRHLAELVGRIATSGGLATYMAAYLRGGVAGVAQAAVADIKSINDIVDRYTEEEAAAASQRSPRRERNAGTPTGTRTSGAGWDSPTDALRRVGGFVGGGASSAQSLLRVQNDALNQLRQIRYSLGQIERNRVFNLDFGAL